jgi:tetrahydromethanopterin S-methyltransferase subunit C
MCLLANVPMFSSIPGQVYGFASTAGYALLSNKAGMMATPTLENPVLIIIVSMVIGALFGYVSEKVAGMLASSRTASA